MSPTEIIERATEAGVLFALSPSGNITARGEQSVIDNWLPVIRRNKTAIILRLRSAEDCWSAEDWLVFFDERAASSSSTAVFRAPKPRPGPLTAASSNG